MDNTDVKETRGTVSALRLPRWRELPDLDIYMDQVLSLITRYFEGYPGPEEKVLTSSMVNNYVKSGIIPPPKKKKYDKEHLAYLVIICILKSVMPIPVIGELISAKVRSGESCGELYDRFCDYYDSVAAAVSGSLEETVNNGTDTADTVFMAALRACAEQSVALKLVRSMTDVQKEEE